jgi:uncharacterized protein (TIGR02598 family)
MKKSFPINAARCAFSLVESVIALGILSFALVALLGLLPTGLTQFKTSKTETVNIEILKFIDTQVQQTEFANLASTLNAARFTFNEEGFLVPENSDARLYAAETRVTVGGVTLPAASAVGANWAPESLARVDVTILHQPAGLPRANATIQSQVALHASNRGQ